VTSKRTDSDSTDGTNRSQSSFARDDRAIEGLPIRLVIALVVGVAALAIMLNMLGGIGSVGDTEVTVKIADADQVIDADATGSDAKVDVYAMDENGNNVSDATIVATADSAQQTAFSTNRPAMTTTQSSTSTARRAFERIRTWERSSSR